MRVLIVGCGYVGIPLGTELARQGHEIFGVRRSIHAEPELKTAGIQLLTADVTQPESLSQLPGPFDWIVNTVASSQGDETDYRKVYLDGTRNLIRWLTAAPPQKYVYTSSTGVYGQNDGSAVKESHPAEPPTATGRVLLETEDLLLQAVRERKLPAVILRVAGIYGPDRGYWLKQYLNNEARIPGRGERLLNMIHVDDVVGAIIAALKNGRPGEIYNTVDNEPVTLLTFFRWLAENLGRDLPPFVPEDETEPRKRGLTNKRVQNRKLTMELGYRLKHPTFRQGYTAEMRRLDKAGLLE